MHDLNDKFEQFSYSKEVNFICHMLGFQSPIIVQSMYIFKNNLIGGEVDPHTDNTYIRTKPLSCKVNNNIKFYFYIYRAFGWL